MPTREELKSLIDQMAEEKLDRVRVNLENILNPPAPNPRMEKMMRLSEEFEGQFPERLKQLQAGNSPEIPIPRGFHEYGSGSGFSYSWQENRAHVTHSVQPHGGHEIDFVDRLELSDDEMTLIYEQEIYAGGRSVKRREEFLVI